MRAMAASMDDAVMADASMDGAAMAAGLMDGAETEDASMGGAAMAAGLTDGAVMAAGSTDGAGIANIITGAAVITANLTTAGGTANGGAKNAMIGANIAGITAVSSRWAAIIRPLDIIVIPALTSVIIWASVFSRHAIGSMIPIAIDCHLPTAIIAGSVIIMMSRWSTSTPDMLSM